MELFLGKKQKRYAVLLRSFFFPARTALTGFFCRTPLGVRRRLLTA